MSKFEYSTSIGDYNSDIRLSIELRMAGGLDKEDYATLREAFKTIEEMVYLYQQKAAPLNTTDITKGA